MQTGKSKTSRKPAEPVFRKLPKTPDDRLFEAIESYITFGGSQDPTEATSFLVHEFVTDDKTPLKKWDNKFVADIIWEVNRLNRFLAQLEFLYSLKKETDRLEQQRQSEMVLAAMAKFGHGSKKRR